MASPQESRLIAAEKRLLQTSAANLRLIVALLAFVAVIAAFETPLYGILVWITEMYRRGNVEEDWWKCLVYDANFTEHYIESDVALRLIGALATSIFQSLLCALLAVILVQRASIRIDWVSSAIVNSLFLGLNVLLPNFNPSFLPPKAIQSSLAILSAYVKPDMFDRIPKPNKCQKAYRFAKLVLDVEYAAVFCCFLSMVLAVRLAVRRRLAIRALRHARILMTSTHHHEDNTIRSHLLERADLRRSSTGVFVNSECGSSIGIGGNNGALQQREIQDTKTTTTLLAASSPRPGAAGGMPLGQPSLRRTTSPGTLLGGGPRPEDDDDDASSACQQYVSVIPLKIAVSGLLVGTLLILSYLTDVVALTRIALLSQKSVDNLPKSIPLMLEDGSLGGGQFTLQATTASLLAARLTKGFVFFVSNNAAFSLSSLVFFIFSLFLRGVAGDDLAPVRLAAIFTFALFVYSAPMYAAHVHDVVMYDLYKPSNEVCRAYLTGSGNGAQVYYYPQGDDVIQVCRYIRVHFWAAGLHTLSIAGLFLVCVAAFALNPGVRLISPAPHAYLEGGAASDDVSNLEQGHMVVNPGVVLGDHTGYEVDLRGPPTRQFSFLRDPTLNGGQFPVVHGPSHFPSSWSDVATTVNGRGGRQSPRVRRNRLQGGHISRVPEHDAASLPDQRSDSLDSGFSFTESCPAGIHDEKDARAEAEEGEASPKKHHHGR